MAAKKSNSNAKSKRKSKRGGSRANAGRKPSEAKALQTEIVATGVETPDAIARAEPLLKRRLIRCLKNLFKLADGGFVREKITREPSGTVTAKVVLRNPDGTPVLDVNGRPVVAEQLLFPDLPPDQLVIVSHTAETAAPDRAANQYLIDRILGKPHTAEPSKAGDTTNALPSILEAALARAYGDEAEPEPRPAIEV
ncbi:MAG: hypothetical protein JWN86_3608 [Planctomycetota bacterium]|nr:hypothetical protein [Planctomycetota bacterium]